MKWEKLSNDLEDLPTKTYFLLMHPGDKDDNYHRTYIVMYCIGRWFTSPINGYNLKWDTIKKRFTHWAIIEEPK